MNVNELYENIKQYLSHGGGEDIVVVRTNGVACSCSKIKGMFQGFDWYSGRAILEPDETLSKVDVNRYSFYREQYLLKNSNLRKVREDKATRGVFKKKIQPDDVEGERKENPEVWLWKQLEIDYQKRG